MRGDEVPKGCDPQAKLHLLQADDVKRLSHDGHTRLPALGWGGGERALQNKREAQVGVRFAAALPLNRQRAEGQLGRKGRGGKGKGREGRGGR